MAESWALFSGLRFYSLVHMSVLLSCQQPPAAQISRTLVPMMKKILSLSLTLRIDIKQVVCAR